MSFVRCLHPKLIENPYTHEKVLIPCRHCEMCLQAKSLEWRNKLELEENAHKYCLFFTLTYDNCHLPVFQKSPENPHKLVAVEYDTGRNGVMTKVGVRIVYESDLDLSDPKDKRYYDRYTWFSYPKVRDIQNFKKRLADRIKYYFKDSNVPKELQTFRSFITSEYGPRTHRVHYHGLLFFDSTELAKVIRKILSESWPLCDKSLTYKYATFSKKRVNSYVTKYTVKGVGVPAMYEYPQFRQIRLFSKRPCIGHTERSREEIRKIVTESTLCYGLPNAKYHFYDNIRFPRSFVDRWFPKIPRFDPGLIHQRVELISTVLSQDGNVLRYRDFLKRAYSLIRKWRQLEGVEYNSIEELFFTSKCCMPIAEYFSNLRDFFVIRYKRDDTLWREKSRSKSCNYIVGWQRVGRFSNFHKCVLSSDLDYHDCFSTVKSRPYPNVPIFDTNFKNLYYLFKRIVDNARYLGFSLKEYLGYIDDYYVKLNYDNLCKQLSMEAEYVKEHPLQDLIHIDPAFPSFESREYSLDGLAEYHKSYYDFVVNTYLTQFGIKSLNEFPKIENTYEYKKKLGMAKMVSKDDLRTRGLNEESGKMSYCKNKRIYE